jgi:hypothetical protein
MDIIKLIVWVAEFNVVLIVGVLAVKAADWVMDRLGVPSRKE